MDRLSNKISFGQGKSFNTRAKQHTLFNHWNSSIVYAINVIPTDSAGEKSSFCWYEICFSQLHNLLEYLYWINCWKVKIIQRTSTLELKLVLPGGANMLTSLWKTFLRVCPEEFKLIFSFLCGAQPGCVQQTSCKTLSQLSQSGCEFFRFVTNLAFC